MADRHPMDIERQLERDRVALAQSLVTLRDRLQPSALVAEGKAALLSEVSPLLSPLVARLDSTVRSKPLIASVAGIALAALIFGGRRMVTDTEAAAAVPALAGTKFEALSRWEDEGGPPAPEPLDPDEDWLHTAQSLHDRAKELLARIDDAARRGLAPAAQLARHRAEVMAALASDTKAALGKGLGSLSDAAREQALLARERIYLGRIAMAEKGRDTLGAHPLLAGGLAAAVGGAIACLFPPTETEDRLLGDARDQLLGEVKATVRVEMLKASNLARTLSAALGRDLDQARTLLHPTTHTDGAPIRHH